MKNKWICSMNECDNDQYLYSSFLYGPLTLTPMYSAYSYDKVVNSASKAFKCNLATFSSNSLGKT